MRRRKRIALAVAVTVIAGFGAGAAFAAFDGGRAITSGSDDTDDATSPDGAGPPVPEGGSPPPPGAGASEESATEDGSGDDPAPETIEPEQLGVPLVRGGADGVDIIAPDGRRQRWESAVRVVFARESGVALQERDPAAPGGFGAIRWLADDADDASAPIAVADELPVLHGVFDVDGTPRVLFTRREAADGGPSHGGDGEVEILYAHDIVAGSERSLGIVARSQSYLDAVAVLDDALVVNPCHLSCWPAIVPFVFGELDSDLVERLRDHAEPLAGLAAAGRTVAYAELGGAVDVGFGAVTLWLHDLDTGDRRAIELPSIDLDLAAPLVTVDLRADGSGVLVGLAAWDAPDDVRMLFVDQLDREEARVRFVDTSGWLRFVGP